MSRTVTLVAVPLASLKNSPTQAVTAWAVRDEPRAADDDVVHIHRGCAGIRHHATGETAAGGVVSGDHVPAALHREAVRNRQGRSHVAAVGGQREVVPVGAHTRSYISPRGRRPRRAPTQRPPSRGRQYSNAGANHTGNPRQLSWRTKQDPAPGTARRLRTRENRGHCAPPLNSIHAPLNIDVSRPLTGQHPTGDAPRYCALEWGAG